MANPKVLVIDDDPLTCQLMETFLSMENFDTASINYIDDNGISPILQQYQPNVVIFDVHLGSHETLGYVRDIRASEGWSTLPIIMTSAIDYSSKCLKAGANQFVQKPFNWEDITQRIRNLLSNSVYQEV